MEVQSRKRWFKGESREGRTGVKCKNRMDINTSAMRMFGVRAVKKGPE